LTIRSIASSSARVMDWKAEVEPQPVWRHERPGLLHVRAEHLPERGVQQMRAVWFRRVALRTSASTSAVTMSRTPSTPDVIFT